MKHTSHHIHESIRLYLEHITERPEIEDEAPSLQGIVQKITIVNNLMTNGEDVTEEEVFEVFESSKTLRDMYLEARVNWIAKLG